MQISYQTGIRSFLCTALLISPLFGFGQNKVQYTNFSWRYLPASHFTLYYHQNEGDMPAITYKMTENIYRTLQRRFKFTHREPVPVIIYGAPNLFSQTNVITELLPEGVGGFTELFKNRVVVPFPGSYNEFNHVLHHEMVHAFVYGLIYDKMGSNLLMGGGIQLPLWFMEGLAEFLSSGWNVESDMFLMDYAITAEVPPPGPGLNGYMAYKGGQSFLLFLHQTRGDSLFTRLLRNIKSSKSLDYAIKAVYKKTTEELGKEWLQELKRLYWPEIGRRADPAKHATAITSHITQKDNFNLRPRISPDGKLIAFYSDRYDYTKILIADRKGKVVHEISQNGYGGFFESFHPFRSGMCWSQDGKRLAFVTKGDGHDQIRIVDITKKRLEKTIDTHLSSIEGPDWSHSGEKITFTGVDSGMSNIYLYHLAAGTLERLTEGHASKYDPHFTRDDSTIIFSIQDSSTRVDDPPMSAWGENSSELALLDIGTASIRAITSTPWNEKQPCFSPKDDRVLFVSDRNGIDNIYIARIDSIDNARPITDYIGGCSNPDWSSDGKSVVFTLFQKLGWDVWLMEKPLEKIVADSLQKTRWVESMLDSSRHYFTPARPPKKNDTALAVADAALKKKRKESKDTPGRAVASKALDSASGKKDESPTRNTAASTDSPVRQVVADSQPAAATDTTKGIASTDASSAPKDAKPVTLPASEPYRLKFSPDLVTVGLGMSSFYGYAGQWLLSFSDIMGDHRITLAGDVQNDFTSTMHFFGAYEYSKHRIDFGGGAYYYKDYTFFSDSLYYYDADLGGFLSASYPFSLFSRLDFQIFARKIDRTPRGDSSAVANSGGPFTVNTVLPSVSYSFDNILWGITGPANGTRARASLEVMPPIPFIDDPFISFQVDFRKYLRLFKRFVWANRLYLGASQPLSSNPSPRRYLLGGNDNWLYSYSDINFGQYENNVRYAFYSDFVVPFRGWRYFDFTGTRVAVLNSEFRFPFIKEFSTVFPLPLAIRYVNGAVFADIGNAWERGETIAGLPLPQKAYGGIGFGCRVNLGMFVLRYDRGWPIEMGKIFKSNENPFIRPPVNYYSLGAEF